MIELDYDEFPELIKSMNTRLATDVRSTSELRQQMADAEMHGIWLSQYVRELAIEVDKKTAAELDLLMKNPPEKIKLTVDTIEMLLNDRTSSERAKLAYVKELQQLIKSRCLMGQTFLNSMNVERASSNFS